MGSLRGQEALVVELLSAIGEGDLVNRLPESSRSPMITTAQEEAVGRISVRRSQ